MLDFSPVLADIEPHVGIDAHVLVGNPDQGKAGNEVAAPIVIEQLVAGDKEKENGHIMAEAIFAGKNIKKLAQEITALAIALPQAKLAGLAEYFFMRHRPGNGPNGDGQDEETYKLHGQRHP